jgi:peroxiredoxin
MAENVELSVGAQAIDFTLMDANGHQVSLHDYLNEKNVYLFFVREFN